MDTRPIGPKPKPVRPGGPKPRPGRPTPAGPKLPGKPGKPKPPPIKRKIVVNEEIKGTRTPLGLGGIVDPIRKKGDLSPDTIKKFGDYRKSLKAPIKRGR